MPRTKAKPKATTPTASVVKAENNGIQDSPEQTINLIKSSRGKTILEAEMEEVKIAKKASSSGRGKRKIPEQTNEVLKEEAAELKEPKAVTKGRSKKTTTATATTTKKNIKVEVAEFAQPVEEKPITNKRGRKTSTSSSTVATVEEIKTEVEETAKKPKSRASSRKASSIVSDDAPTPKKRAKSEPKSMKETKISSAVKTKRKNATSRELDAIDEIPEDVKYEVAVVPVVAEKKTRGRKRASPAAVAVAVDEDVAVVEENDVADGAKPAKAKKTAATPLNSITSKYNKADFELSVPKGGKNMENGNAAKRFNLKISSWNVAGLRSWLKKDGLKFLDYEEPDIFCLQEIKCTTDQLPEEAARIPGYHPYWLCMPGGYAGVAIYSKIMPIHVEYGINNPEFDASGRIITAEYEKFFLINVYVPNSGRKLVNLEPRMRWEKLFQDYVQRLDARKPVIVCGDMNVSHTEIDLANPKSNTRNAGFTQEERDKMSELLALGYVDTFRHLYPQHKGAYTFWTYMGNARSRNVGWRLDYFLVSERFVGRVVENCMRTQCMGSDHCPITLFLKL